MERERYGYRVIASLNEDLRLPILPEDFLKIFVTAFNDGELITRVEVEMERFNGCGSCAGLGYVSVGDNMEACS